MSNIEILIEVASKHNITVKKMLSKSRKQNIVMARIEAARRLRELGYSLERIGMALHRDHSTIAYYLKTT